MLEWIRNKPKWQWSFWRKHMIRDLKEIKEKKRIAQEKPVTDKTGTEEQAKDDKQKLWKSRKPKKWIRLNQKKNPKMAKCVSQNESHLLSRI